MNEVYDALNASLASFVVELSEADFQQQVTRLAENLGWHWMHVKTTGKGQHFPIRGTLGKGWPDLFLTNPRRGFIFAELKRDKQPLTPHQRFVIQLLRDSGATVYVWRPSDWAEIVEVLSR